jgi:LysM domain
VSTITATRTGRFAPPAPPTRRPVPRRRLSGHGAAPVGGADRPVLRIVASRPAVQPEPPSVGWVLPSLEPQSPSVELVETTAHVDLDRFFAAEYDGDDVRLEVGPARRGSVRLTRRGRVVVLGAGLGAALGLGLLGASHARAGDQPEQTKVITVRPGQTLWDIASTASAQTGDTRSMISHLEALNHLDSTTLQVGQHLRVPR